VARHYGDILDLYIADQSDVGAVGDPGIPVICAPTLMLSLRDREALARTVIEVVGRGF
jgi:hypothetical protein